MIRKECKNRLFLLSDELIDKVSIHENIPEEELKVRLWRAYEFGSEYHQGQKRKSGESYFHSHCVEVAKTLASWKMDHVTIIGGMLHDVIEDTDATINQIENEFGKEVAYLINGVSKLSGIQFSNRSEKQAGNFMKMLILNQLLVLLDLDKTYNNYLPFKLLFFRTRSCRSTRSC